MYTIKDYLKSPEIQDALSEENLDFVYSRFFKKWGANSSPNLLTKILIGADVQPLHYMTYIPKYMYAELPVKEITIPSQVSRIEKYAFLRCKDLEKVIIKHDPDSLEQGIFSECPNLTVYCTADCTIIQSYCLTYDIPFKII